MIQYASFVTFLFLVVSLPLVAQKRPVTFHGYFIMEETITKITSDKDVGPRRDVRILYIGNNPPNINTLISDSSYLNHGLLIQSASTLYKDSASASEINQVIDDHSIANNIGKKELLNPMHSAFNAFKRFNINTADFEGKRIVIFHGSFNIYEFGAQFIFFNEPSNIVSPLYLVAW